MTAFFTVDELASKIPGGAVHRKSHLEMLVALLRL